MPVSQPVTSPVTLGRQQLITVLKDEFAEEEFPVYSDKLHKSLGDDGHTRIGVSPLQEVPMSSNKLLMQFGLLVQFYGAWKKLVDPKQRVDPTLIETYAERFKRAIWHNDPNTQTAWYFSLVDVTYPEDPTGNITRFEARVTCYGENTTLVETVG